MDQTADIAPPGVEWDDPPEAAGLSGGEDFVPLPDWWGAVLAEEPAASGEVSPIIWDGDVPIAHRPEVVDPPGHGLAEELNGVCLQALDDRQVLDVAAAWRRLGSWAKAGELAAVAEFSHRRRHLSGHPQAAEASDAELQLALGYLSNLAVGRLTMLAAALAGPLRATGAALRAGVIDEAKAFAFADGILFLDDEAAHQIEAELLSRAPGMSTGQLRAAIARAVLRIDPAAAEKRRRRSQAGRRVELCRDDQHTASLSGRDLPEAQALAADAHLTAWAKTLKADGDRRSLQFLRAQVFTALLTGTSPTTITTPTGKPDSGSPDSTSPGGGSGGHPGGGLADDADGDVPAGVAAQLHITVPASALHHPSPQPEPDTEAKSDAEATPKAGEATTATPAATPQTGPRPGTAAEGTDLSGVQAADTATDQDTDEGAAANAGDVAVRGTPVIGTVSLIVPLSTLCQASDVPGEVPGFGTISAASARILARVNPNPQICYTVTDSTGRAIDHGHLHTDGGAFDRQRFITAILTDRANRAYRAKRQLGGPGEHDHREDPGPYQVRGELRHRIQVRDRNCRFPGCRRPATQSDIDHTIPWNPGPTCECNLAALCRRHHAVKQSPGWTLSQPTPGQLIWATPTGQKHATQPGSYDDPPF